ncbi:hypothetical protein [Candidatus Xenohaliotis californiensis]
MHRFHTILSELYHLSFEGIVFGATAAILSLLIAPMQYLKIMRQETGKKYLNIAKNSYKMHGISVFFRAAIAYSLLNFVSSASFGVSNYFSNLLLKDKQLLFFAPMLRSLLGGLIETLATLRIEIREINKNKGNNNKNETSLLTMALLILMRNSVFWLGATISFEITKTFNLNAIIVFWLTLLTGLFAGILSTPVDAVATRVCGAEKTINIINACHQIIKGDRNIVFAGTVIRIQQIILYTILTEWVMEGSKQWINIVFSII